MLLGSKTGSVCVCAKLQYFVCVCVSQTKIVSVLQCFELMHLCVCAPIILCTICERPPRD